MRNEGEGDEENENLRKTEETSAVVTKHVHIHGLVRLLFNRLPLQTRIRITP